MIAFYAARNGNCRVYFKSAHAIAYERAYAAFPLQPWGLEESPDMDGYRDAKSAADHVATCAACAHAAAHPNHRKELTCTA